MKFYSFFCFVCLLPVLSYSQMASNYYLDVYDNSGKRINANQNSNINGSPHLYGIWGVGSVVINNRQQYSEVPLEFDIETNTLYFRKDSTAYKLSGEVNSFHVTYPDSLRNKTVYFKSGFPNDRGYPTSLLYQVIAEGSKASFLKFLRVHTEQHAEYGMEPKQMYVMSEELWIYNTALKRMFKINRNKNSILKAFTDSAKAIEKFASDKQYKLNSDKEIAEAITYLNTLP